MACIRKRRGKWVVDYRDALGIRRWFTCESKREADDVLAEKIGESRQGVQRPNADTNITVERYADLWLEQVSANIAPKTLESYRDLLRLHIRPALGITKVRQVHRGMIKALLAEKRKPVTRPDGTVKPGLGKNTVRLIRATLSVMLADAVDDGLLRTNPARDVGGHRKRADTMSLAERQKKIRPLSREQLAALLGVTLERVITVEGMRAGSLPAIPLTF